MDGWMDDANIAIGPLWGAASFEAREWQQCDVRHLLQAKLAKLRRDLLDPQSSANGGAGGGGRGEGFDVNKVGDARVGLVGAPQTS